MDAYAQACEICGGVSALARRIGDRVSTVGNWRQRGVPLDRCAAIEAATGVRCDDLRPDVEWIRDADGRVTGYHVRVDAAPPRDDDAQPARHARATREGRRPANEPLDPAQHLTAAPAAKVA